MKSVTVKLQDNGRVYIEVAGEGSMSLDKKQISLLASGLEWIMTTACTKYTAEITDSVGEIQP